MATNPDRCLRTISPHRPTILRDLDIDVIVELIDDAEAAWTIVRQAVEHGKDVVTANKRMVAQRLDVS